MIVGTDRVAWWHVVAGEGGEVLETHLGDIDLSGGGWAVVTRLMGRVTTHTKLITTSAANEPSVSQSVFTILELVESTY